MRPALYILLALVLASFTCQGQSSVLGQGTWKKLATPTKGIYKLGRSDFQAMGLNPGSLDPREIQIFGSGGGMLPQSNAVERPLGLSEIAIYVSGEQDGSFDEGDFVLFYSDGPDEIAFQTSTGAITYQKNLYADSAYYFLTVSQTAGLRVLTKDNQPPNAERISVFPELVIHEVDETNIISSGRYWVGESFSAGAMPSKDSHLRLPAGSLAMSNSFRRS